MRISPGSFYLPAHGLVFKACLALYEKGSPVNEITVLEGLKAEGVLEKIGGYPYLCEINNRIETPAHLMFYAQKVKEMELARRLVTFFITELDNAYGGFENIDYFLERVEQKVLEIGEDRISESAISIEQSMERAVNTVQLLSQKHGAINGLGTGFRDLDHMTFGFHSGEMIVLAARPSMGKTALALNVAEYVVFGDLKSKRVPVPTLFFSLEMSSEQLALRLLCGRSRVNMTKLREGFLDKASYRVLGETATEAKKVPLWIDESACVSILEMRAKARRMHAQHRLGLVVVDYLQLVSGTDPKLPREQQIAEISRGFKAMANELNIPVLVLSQLNRESEKERRQPRLSDLRESGAIEQDADLVLLLSRRNAEETESASENTVVRDLVIAKQRNGPVGIVPLTFVKGYTRFENYAHENSPG
jgi:replicative DNA helicase